VSKPSVISPFSSSTQHPTLTQLLTLLRAHHTEPVGNREQR
jgi:hypothetical protein